jgi:glutamyl-tRNA reductase
MRPRRDRPLFMIDIGLPRDVEPSASEVEQVFLYNIDDLQSIVRENLARRQTQVDRAELMVRQEVEGFMRWLRSRGAVPTVVALRKHFERTRQQELQRLYPKLASLSPAAKARVDEVTRLLVEKLLSSPTERLKAAPDEEAVAADADTLSRLFGLEEDADSLRRGPRDRRAAATAERAPAPRNR